MSVGINKNFVIFNAFDKLDNHVSNLLGKSTLFNALVGSELAQAANFPFCTIEPNVGLGISFLAKIIS